MNQRLITVSKFLSKYLRHEPEALGFVLESGGWVSVDDLLAAASRIGFSITVEELKQVVAENDKQRFSFDATGSKIRANQGHSTAVDPMRRTKEQWIRHCLLEAGVNIARDLGYAGAALPLKSRVSLLGGWQVSSRLSPHGGTAERKAAKGRKSQRA